MFARKDIERDILSNYRQYGRHMRLQQERLSEWPRVFVDSKLEGSSEPVENGEQNMALDDQPSYQLSSDHHPHHHQSNRTCSWASDAGGTASNSHAGSRSASLDMSRVGSQVIVEIEEAAHVVLRKLTNTEKEDLAENQ